MNVPVLRFGGAVALAAALAIDATAGLTGFLCAGRMESNEDILAALQFAAR